MLYPAELLAQIELMVLLKMVGATGFEPATFRLRRTLLNKRPCIPDYLLNSYLETKQD